MKQRERRKAQRPGEILEAAFDAFAERGFAGTRMEDVAARAGVTKGAIYFYFETKERLFEEMVGHYSQETLRGRRGQSGGGARRLRGTAEGLHCLYVRALRAGPPGPGDDPLHGFGREGFPQPGRAPLPRFLAPAMRMVSELLVAGAANGEFRPEFAAIGAEIVIAPSVFLSLMRLIFDDSLEIDEDAYIAAHIDLLLNGLLTPAARKTRLPERLAAAAAPRYRTIFAAAPFV